MAWYKAGTVAVTNGSATVTGSGTAFVANVQVGDVFHGPDERQYEIQSVNSDTQLTLASNYLGSTQSGQSYKIQPTRGVTAALLASVNSLISNFQGAANTALAGKFGNGSAAAPGVTFDADQDTGLFRKAANVLGFAVGGAEKATLSGSGMTVNVPISGTAVQTSKSDVTAGRLMRADYGYGPGNLLGTVSQSGGDPTGKVIERGSNSNGEYVRFADGTQMCWTSVISPLYDSDVSGQVSAGASVGVTWTFPATFDGSTALVKPVIAGASGTIATQVLAAANFTLAASDGNPTTSYVAAVNQAAISRPLNLHAMAIGRWY